MFLRIEALQPHRSVTLFKELEIVITRIDYYVKALPIRALGHYTVHLVNVEENAMGAVQFQLVDFVQDLEHLQQDLPELELGQVRCFAQFKAVRRQVLDADCPAVLGVLAGLLAADLW